MKPATLVLLMTAALAAQESHFTAAKQLTFGGANAEAYYSPDGSKIIFQATREGYKCDQMYVMNSDGSDQHMVSSGKGRTTCGFFLPDGKSIMYASTHEAAPDCPPDPDRSKGYLWGVYASYDIYVADLSGKILRKFLPSPGYDAEATINWMTKKVIFTSVRDGDLNLWSANLDGTHLTELTQKLGYDGGAVFSPDGKKILWRSHYPTAPDDVKDYKDKLAQELVAPMKMELMIADAAGKNARQVTDFGCASFAPAFSPDGKKIIFSSNKNKCDRYEFNVFVADWKN